MRDSAQAYIKLHKLGLLHKLLHKLGLLGLLHKLGLLVNARRRGMMVSRIKMMHEVVMEWLCTLLVIV